MSEAADSLKKLGKLGKWLTVVLVLVIATLALGLWSYIHALSAKEFRAEQERLRAQMDQMQAAAAKQEDLLRVQDQVGATAEALQDVAVEQRLRLDEIQNDLSTALSLEDLQQALANVERALTEINRQVTQAAVQTLQGQLDRMEQAVDQSSKLSSQNTQTLASHGAVLADLQGRVQEAKDQIVAEGERTQAAVKEVSDRFDPMHMGRRFYYSGEYGAAVALLKVAAAETPPQNTEPYALLREACQAAAARNSAYRGEYVRFIAARLTDPTANPDDLVSLFTSQTEDVRLAVLEELHAMGKEPPAKLFTAAIHDASDSVRGRALRSLPPASPAQLLDELASVLNDEQSEPRIRLLAARKIGELDTVQADDVLIRARDQAKGWMFRRSLSSVLLRRRTDLYNQVLQMDPSVQRDQILKLVDRILKLDSEHEGALRMKARLGG